ncbi:hypothetical protein [uncultured Lacinutrix sp.]|uniref:hypothetical protein n=1 Tax=uncultured Lacinutrix sp. TaxID=574032 RepID=UPI00260777F3|nr:hypothetical protein [uncultured Lacinutrix sp.]
MLNNVNNIFKSKNKYYLLGICVDQNVSLFQLLIVTYNNGVLDIEDRYLSNSLESLFKEKYKKKYPVILYTESADVVNKKVVYETGYRSNILFKANLEDFYFYEYTQHKDIFVSVVRKDYINQLITDLEHFNLTVIHLSFGPFVLANVFPILTEEKSLASFKHVLNISNKSILDFSKTENEVSYKINEDAFNQKELPLIASFFDFKFPIESINFENDFLSKNKEDYKYKVWLKNFGTAAIVLLLLSIVVSHNLLDTYLTKLGEKQSLYVFSNQKIEQLNNQKEELKLKESILQSSSLFNKSYVTKYYADIGNSTPLEVTLKTIDFLPIDKKIRTNEKVIYSNKTIVINGETNNDNAFNNWIEKLRKIKWVKKIEIIDYKQEKKNNNTFILNIKF